MTSERKLKFNLERNYLGLYLLISSVTFFMPIVFRGIYTRENSWLFVISAIGMITSPVIPGWVLIFNLKTKSEDFLKLLETIVVIGTSLSIGFLLITRTMHGDCGDSEIYDSWHCNPGHASHSLPQDSGNSHFLECLV